MSNQLITLETPELNQIETSKAKQIQKTFEPMGKLLTSFEKSYNEVLQLAKNGIDYELTEQAKRLRIDIGKVRIETGKLKDKQKEYIKLEDKAIMGVHNILVWAVKEKEDKLKEIEKHFEIQEQKRLEALQKEREEAISMYVPDAGERDLSQMHDDVWEAYFSAKKKAWEDEQEAIRKAEEERIAREKAEEEERQRIAEENQRLKIEAEQRERLAKIEAEKQDKIEAERKEKERKEREAYEAKLEAERKERERIQKELQEKQDAEKKAKEEEEARIQLELTKGDAAKVKDLISDLNELKTKYSFKSAKNTKMYNEVGQLLDKIINHIA